MKYLTIEQLEALQRISLCCSSFIGFEFDGLIVKGFKSDVIRSYILENPDKKFRTWLIDSGQVVNQIN